MLETERHQNGKVKLISENKDEVRRDGQVRMVLMLMLLKWRCYWMLWSMMLMRWEIRKKRERKQR